MAETRKHRVEVRDELDQALRAALDASTGVPANEEPEGSPAEPAASSFIAPGSTIAGFTFGHDPRPRS